MNIDQNWGYWGISRKHSGLLIKTEHRTEDGSRTGSRNRGRNRGRFLTRKQEPRTEPEPKSWHRLGVAPPLHCRSSFCWAWGISWCWYPIEPLPQRDLLPRSLSSPGDDLLDARHFISLPLSAFYRFFRLSEPHVLAELDNGVRLEVLALPGLPQETAPPPRLAWGRAHCTKQV